MTQRTTICWLLAGAAVLSAEIVDRVAVTMGYQVITASDIDREIRVSAFLNRTRPDFSPASKRQTADRMVEQRLVRREVELSRFPVPDRSEVDPVLAKFKKESFPDAKAYDRALAEAGVTDQEVRDQILWQLTLMRFIDIRFGPAVQVSDEEIADYFEKTIAPAAKAAKPGETPSLDDYHDKITEILTQQQVDRLLDEWIAEARKRAGVEYRKEVFEK